MLKCTVYDEHRTRQMTDERLRTIFQFFSIKIPIFSIQSNSGSSLDAFMHWDQHFPIILIIFSDKSAENRLRWMFIQNVYTVD